MLKIPIEKEEGSMFLLGEYQNRIDPRGRAFVPVKFREQVGAVVYMVIDSRNCIECFDEKGIADKYENLSSAEGVLDSSTAVQGLNTHADTQLVDTQGRIIIKPEFIELIGADKDVVFLGARNHFEIWAKDEYEKMKKHIEERTKRANNLKDEEEEIRILEREVELQERRKALLKRLEEK